MGEVPSRRAVSTKCTTVNLRYSDSGYSDNLGYSDRFVRIKLVKLAKVLPRYSHNFVCLIHIAITKVDCNPGTRHTSIIIGLADAIF